MGFACLATFKGFPRVPGNAISTTEFRVRASFSPTRSNAAVACLNLAASSFAERITVFRGWALGSNSAEDGVSLRPCLNFPPLVVKRSNFMKVRAGKAALGCTKRSRSRKSRARVHGFRIRMRSPGGRRVLKRRFGVPLSLAVENQLQKCHCTLLPKGTSAISQASL